MYLDWGGGSAQPIWMQTPRCRTPPNTGPPDADPPSDVTCDTLLGSQPPPPPVDRMADACENITLAQTSFAGGNYLLTQNNFIAEVALFLLLVHQISDQNGPCNCFAQIDTHHVPFSERDFEIQVISASLKIEKNTSRTGWWCFRQIMLQRYCTVVTPPSTKVSSSENLT